MQIRLKMTSVAVSLRAIKLPLALSLSSTVHPEEEEVTEGLRISTMEMLKLARDEILSSLICTMRVMLPMVATVLLIVTPA